MKFKEYLEEKTKEVVTLTFDDLKEYHKATGLLYKTGYKETTSMDKGKGYYTKDDNWYSIQIGSDLEKEIVKLFKRLNYTSKKHKPMAYKVFDHGGHLD